MDVKELAKEWRIWIYILTLLGATLLLSPSLAQENGEVVIQTNLENNTGIDFTGGTKMLLDVNESAYEGELSDAELVDRVRDTVEIRLQQARISDPSVRRIDLGGEQYRIQVIAAADNQSRVEGLIKREGSFEARMPYRVTGTENFSLGDTTLTFTREGENLSVKQLDRSFRPGETFEAGGTEFLYNRSLENYAELSVLLYRGDQVQDALLGDRRAGVSETSQGATFKFPVVITQEAAEMRYKVAQNYGESVGGSRSYLIHENGDFARSALIVDGEQASSLKMGSSFKSSEATQSTISGGGTSVEEARAQMEELAAVLQSGALPAPIEVVSSSQLSSSLGDKFLRASILSITGSLIATGLIIFLRYGNPKVAAAIVVTGLSEIYILMGFWFTTIGTLTLSAVAGIVAAIGTGVDDQIIITDESDRKKASSWRQRMKRAFFVIFTSAASTTGAMLPIVYPGLMSFLLAAAGFGLLAYSWSNRSRSYTAVGATTAAVGTGIFLAGPSGAALATIHQFAFTTIIGILIGISVTRPAFAKLLEQLD